MRNRYLRPCLGPVAIVSILLFSQNGFAATTRSISQYGITWYFDRKAEVGQFITGDWWVLGPVTVLSVAPAPGPSAVDEEMEIRKNPFGDAALTNDHSMRNGSMMVVRGSTGQGYDSRPRNYDPAMSIKYPLPMQPNQSLISSVSHTTSPNDNFCHELMWPREKRVDCVLKTAAVLTCLLAAPPADAFRPSYGGIDKKIYRAGDLKRERLATLTPVGEVPSWPEFERYFQRPWIDHIESWMIQSTAPTENLPGYGREYGRLVSMAGLMLQLDLPPEKKEKLLLEFTQLGIDLSGLHLAGTVWDLGGGHSSGRKWPILFASLVLGDENMLIFREDTNFQEDGQTYYGEGWFGQPALWQMLIHHGERRPYEERPPEQWDAMDQRSEGYRRCCTARAWIGTCLAARYMYAVRAWNHDAFFDYCDRWMSIDDPYADGRGGHERPEEEGKTFDPWIDAMWHAYRETAPSQPGGEMNMKWVWEDGGKWVTNSRPTIDERGAAASDRP